MNYAIVFRLLGYVLMIEGALLLLPAAASLVYGEWMVLGVFLLTAAVSAGIGYALHTIKPRSKVFYMREGFAAVLGVHLGDGRGALCAHRLHPEPRGCPV
jgi:trk system potassium uptake protein TrkH